MKDQVFNIDPRHITPNVEALVGAMMKAEPGHVKRLPPPMRAPSAAETVDPAIVADIRKLSDEGKCFRECGEIVGLSKQKVTTIAYAHGILNQAARRRQEAA